MNLLLKFPTEKLVICGSLRCLSLCTRYLNGSSIDHDFSNKGLPEKVFGRLDHARGPSASSVSAAHHRS